MSHFRFEQPLEKLEPRKGGYYYLLIDSGIVNQFEKKQSVRLKCVIDGKVSLSCGLNHYGDGNFFIIVASRHVKTLGKELGDLVSFEIYEDPNPLGVEMPEVLQVLIDQDDQVKEIFDSLTDGKKRTLIHFIAKVKDVDKQVQKALAFLEEERLKLRKKALK